MSDAFTDAVAGTLAGDATLTAALATYGGGPAIFTSRPVPEDAVPPLVITEGSVTDIGGIADGLRREGREFTRDIAVYFPADNDPTGLEAAAERIRALFHRKKVAVTGFHTVLCRASGPIPAPVEGADEKGRVVTVRFVLQRT